MKRIGRCRRIERNNGRKSVFFIEIHILLFLVQTVQEKSAYIQYGKREEKMR